jgi:exodeoxyribonuclease VII small subunit
MFADDDADSTRTADEPSANSTQPPSFEAGLAQLGEIVNRLEGGGLGLSESIDAYERGVAILRRLHEALAHAEERVSMLTGVDDEGRLIAEPIAVSKAAAKEGEKAGKKPSSRTAAKARTGGDHNGTAARPQTLPGMDGSTDGV